MNGTRGHNVFLRDQRTGKAEDTICECWFAISTLDGKDKLKTDWAWAFSDSGWQGDTQWRLLIPDLRSTPNHVYSLKKKRQGDRWYLQS